MMNMYCFQWRNNSEQNHELVLRALKKLNNKKIKYLLCGHGEEEKNLKNLVTDLQLNDQVLLGL